MLLKHYYNIMNILYVYFTECLNISGAGTVMPYWDFLGSTLVTNNFIRLTGDLKSLKGSLWNKVPCYVQSWEMQIHFKVHGKGKDLFGDGFAFW